MNILTGKDVLFLQLENVPYLLKRRTSMEFWMYVRDYDYALVRDRDYDYALNVRRSECANRAHDRAPTKSCLHRSIFQYTLA